MSDTIGLCTRPAVDPMTSREEQEQLVEDLENRIETLDKMQDEDFGTFTRLDYVILTVGAVLLPILAMVLAR